MLSGANPNCTFCDTSAVWNAASNGTAAILQALIDAGGHPDPVDSIGRSALTALVQFALGEALQRLQVLLRYDAVRLDRVYQVPSSWSLTPVCDTFRGSLCVGIGYRTVLYLHPN